MVAGASRSTMLTYVAAGDDETAKSGRLNAPRSGDARTQREQVRVAAETEFWEANAVELLRNLNRVASGDRRDLARSSGIRSSTISYHSSAGDIRITAVSLILAVR